MKPQLKSEILGKIKAKVLAVNPKAEVILFGSRARGDYREDSDWDLLILVPEEVNLQNKFKYGNALINIELKYAICISTLVYSRGNWQIENINPFFYQNVKEEGVTL